jgi:hypothetical protein
MEPKAKQEGDIEKNNKFTGYQLPNKFKIVGLVVVTFDFVNCYSQFKNIYIGR